MKSFFINSFVFLFRKIFRPFFIYIMISSFFSQAFAFLEPRSNILAKLVGERPKSITLKELINEGDQGNQHIKKVQSFFKKFPQVGNIELFQSLDSMAYFFLSRREKDFIHSPNLYKFYLGLKSLFRGENLHRFNKTCLFRRLNNSTFSLRNFLKGKFGCQAPKELIGLKTDKMIELLELGLKNIKANPSFQKKIGLNAIEMGKSFARGLISLSLNLLFSKAEAVSPNVKKWAKRIGIGVGGVSLIALGAALMFIPIIPLTTTAYMTSIGLLGLKTASFYIFVAMFSIPVGLGVTVGGAALLSKWQRTRP